MPEVVNFKYRIWCKSCNDFTIHDRVFLDEVNHPKHSLCVFNNETLEPKFHSVCECNTVYTEAYLKDIPEDKINEQRKRYRAQRLDQVKNLTSFITKSSVYDTFFDEVSGPKTKIIESSAGVEAIERKLKEERREELIKLANEREQYKNVGRNDVCLCGSGLKYKKCCYSRHKK